MIGEKIIKKNIKLKQIIIFFKKIIISKANGERIYCCNLASEKSLSYTFSTLMIVIKKIIIHKKAKGISNPNETCLSAKENIVEAISKSENKVRLNTLPFNIK